MNESNVSKKYEIPDEVRNNMLAFLSRLDFKGANNFVEIDALQTIRYMLNNPIKESNEGNGNKGE